MTDVTTLPVRHLFTLEANVGAIPPQVIAGPTGTRVIVSVSDGTFKGDRVSGTVAEGAGGDFAVFRPDGTLRLDVRLTLVADDGTRIYVTYNGVGTPAGDGSLSLRTAPTFEAPDGPYVWLNNVQGLGIGESNPAMGTLRYDVYEVL
ncbi:MAG: hypothetical protein QOK28_907 [Actinomycetota bacterium]|jgi:hypothetical protein